ncbi:MAG: sulfatase-like hydrolase/transferase, partial [Verrucomicrobiota bacterium]
SPEEVALWRSGLTSIDLLKEHNITEAFTWANRISNRGIDFLEHRDEEKPFLMVLSYDEPHHPWTCPPEWAERFRDFEFDLGPAGLDPLEGKPPHQKEWASAMDHPARNGVVKSPLVFGCNAYVDHEIGRVLDALDEKELENTYVVYCSDHGEMFGAHDLSLKGCVGYEEITHVPFIVRPPSSMGQAGRQEKTLVNLIDILPTFLDLADEACPPVLQGESLKPLITGERTDVERSSFIEFNRYELDHDSFGGFKPMRVVVHGSYKLVVHLLGADELYHLDDDPWELNNLIEDPAHCEARDDLHARLLDWMDEKRDPFRGPEWERRSWQPRRTREWMGYYRPRPSDGYAEPAYDYDTGRPNQGVKIEAKTTPTE